MREIGRKGGKIGGKRSLETMTPEERTARAKKASAAAAKKRTAERLEREKKAKKRSQSTQTGCSHCMPYATSVVLPEWSL
jgi:hypothetical protein